MPTFAVLVPEFRASVGNQVNKKVMAYFDKKYANMKNFEMPFDEKHLARGGFSVEVG